MAGKNKQNRHGRKQISDKAVTIIPKTMGPLSVIKSEGGQATLKVDLTRVKPPEKVYLPDAFHAEKRVGYFNLYFGSKNPASRHRELLHQIIIRMSFSSVQAQFVDAHKSFYEPIFESNKVSKDHVDEFSFDIESQFNSIIYQVYDSNFVYASHGAGIAEMMFYRISPSVMHQLVSGKAAITPVGSGVEPQITMNMPLDLMSFVYKSIINGVAG